MNHYLTFIIIASACVSLNASHEQAAEQEETHKSCDNGSCTKPPRDNSADKSTRDIDFGTLKDMTDKEKDKRENK